MDATWTSEDVERVTRFDVTGVEPIMAQYSSVERSFQPVSVSITVSMSVSLEDPEPYGPRWEANVRGPWIRKDGKPYGGPAGSGEHTERYWQGHRDVPPWLDVLALRCLGNAGLTLNRS